VLLSFPSLHQPNNRLHASAVSHLSKISQVQYQLALLSIPYNTIPPSSIDFLDYDTRLIASDLDLFFLRNFNAFVRLLALYHEIVFARLFPYNMRLVSYCLPVLFYNIVDIRKLVISVWRVGVHIYLTGGSGR
jgi:hypothetical protein